MIDNKLIKSIIANGGWCEINSNNDTQLSENLNGRILLNANDFLVLDRFKLSVEAFDGFYLFYLPNIQKIRKGNWMKRYLSAGGKVIVNTEVPKEFLSTDWFELLENLQRSKEVVKFKVGLIDIYGSICSYSYEDIQVSPSLLISGTIRKNILLGDLTCIEARTFELGKLQKLARGS
jgi:hypothetical protein